MEQPRTLTLDDVVAFLASPGKAGIDRPDLSPDGRTVLYGWDGSVWSVDAEGAEPARLTEGSHPRWAPDGRALAFLRGEVPQAWVRTLAGEERQVTRADPGITGERFLAAELLWSPDSRSIATLHALAPEPPAPG